MSDPQVIQVTVPASPQVVRVIVNNLPRVVRVNVPGEQGPPGEDGADGGVRQWRKASGAITVSATTDDDIYIGSGAATLTLPAASARANAKPYLFVDADNDADTNAKVITPAGAETIRGLSSYRIQFRGGTVELWPSAEDGGWYAREA